MLTKHRYRLGGFEFLSCFWYNDPYVLAVFLMGLLVWLQLASFRCGRSDHE